MTTTTFRLGPMFFIFIFVVLSGCWPKGCIQDYSDGTRVGYIRKFSEKGLIWKSWEGEMMLTPPAGVVMANVDTFAFSVRLEDTTIVRQVNEAMSKGCTSGIKILPISCSSR